MNKSALILALICALLWAPHPFFADEAPKSSSGKQSPKQMSEIDIASLGKPALRVFTDRDDLPQNSVYSITFDRKGYLWVGTLSGVAYYNGRKWNVVDMPNK
jgi:hypothetical protein